MDEKEDELDAAVAAENEAKAAKAKADTMVAAATAKVGHGPGRRDGRPGRAWRRPRSWSISPPSSPRTPASSPTATFFPGDYVRAATEGGEHTPLLRVERIDKMRLVVDVPDRDVPYCNIGDLADVELDALPGVALEGVNGKRPRCPEWPIPRTPRRA